MTFSIKKTIFSCMLVATLGCQDSQPIIYEVEPGEEEGGDGSRDTGPTYNDPSGQPPQGGIPGTQNPPGSESNVPSSNGSGGLTGFQEVNYGSSSYKIEAPQDAGPNKAYGLHIHLHGDGGGGYRDFPNRQPAHDLIGVAVRAPSRTLQWGRAQGVTHANYLDGLIQQELMTKYNIRTDRIYFSGVSGGAYFLTGHFIPMFGQKYRSGALILCGGMAIQATVQDPSALRDIKMHFITTSGERRDITADINASYNEYQPLYTAVGSANMLSRETVGTAGHCEFDNQSYTSGIQMVINTKFNAVLKN